MFTRRQTLALGGSALATTLLTREVLAQSDYPSKPIELIIPFAPGGGLDLFGRTVARILNDENIVSQRIQVTNLPGAGGSIGMAEMVERNDDNYSLCALALHVHLTPLLQGTPHTYADMTPLARIFSEYEMLVVRAESPIQSLKEVADALVKDVGSISFGGATIGNASHITISKFAQAVGADPKGLTYVAYSGGEATAAILGGHVDVGTGEADLLDLIEAGKLRVLGISAPERQSGRMKDFPTLKEQGYDVVFELSRGLYAPPNMSPDVVRYWHDALAKMVQSDAWKAELEKNEWTNAFLTGDAFRASLDVQHEELRAILKSVELIQ